MTHVPGPVVLEHGWGPRTDLGALNIRGRGGVRKAEWLLPSSSWRSHALSSESLVHLKCRVLNRVLGRIAYLILSAKASGLLMNEFYNEVGLNKIKI